MIKYNNILIPRRIDDRAERYKRIIYQQIQQYIKNGSKGYLGLNYATIDSLPDNLIKADDFYATFSKIKSLNNLESVNVNIHLGHSEIKSLGKLKSVQGWIDLRDTTIEDLGNLKFVGG